MREVKCQWCGSKGVKKEMLCEAKPTGKYNKNGTEKYIRKYFHDKCYVQYEKDKAFKEKEANEFDELYLYLKDLHRLEGLSKRMIERLQDLRNGTVKYQSQKVKRYKKGVPFRDILDTYKYSEQQLHKARDYKQFESPWHEFAYFLSIVVSNINEVKERNRRLAQQDSIRTSVIKKQIQLQDEIDLEVKRNKNKKDELDISSLL